MNKYQADKFLYTIRKTEDEIKSKELKLEALRYKASGMGTIRYDKDHVQTTPQNYMEMVMEDISDLINEIEEYKASLEDIRAQAYSVIRRMKKDDEQTVIIMYYLNCASIEEICHTIHKSQRSVYALKDDAIGTFAKIMSKK